jgi:hypothetical protein
MSESNWIDWMTRTPPYGLLIQVWREGWDQPLVTTRGDFMQSTMGLQWRYTGIARMKLEAMPLEQRMQVEVNNDGFWNLILAQTQTGVVGL